MRYIALLRGINVGGNNIIKMLDLKKTFEEMDFESVKTYIQSGNVLFETAEIDSIKLEEKIEKILSERFNYSSKVIIVSETELKQIVENAPKDFGVFAQDYRYDVLFLKSPLTSEIALESISAREGVDAVYAGNSVLYFSRLISKSGQSYLDKLVGTLLYKQMTIRNWNTTSKLLALCEELN